MSDPVGCCFVLPLRTYRRSSVFFLFRRANRARVQDLLTQVMQDTAPHYELVADAAFTDCLLSVHIFEGMGSSYGRLFQY